MKIRVTRFTAFLIAGVLLSGCLVGCGSEGKTDSKEQLNASAGKEGKDIIKGFYVDEETGEIIDASTGKAVTDGSVKVDEKTGNIVDAVTGKTIATKKEAGQVKQQVNAAATSKKNKEHKEQEKKEDKKQETQASKESSKNSSSDKNNNSGNKNNTTATNSKVPTSNKKVSFNKDKLYKMMMATCKEPNYIKEQTKKNFPMK